MRANARAHELYLRMGFRDWCETPVRVVSYLPDQTTPVR
jgi:hypothetical protein